MSPFHRFYVAIAICAVLTTTNAYCADEMPVLFLDGRAHVELPRNLFDRTTQATIEVWVKWNRFNEWSRVFDFGRKDNAVVLQNEKSSNTLNYRIWDRSGKRHGTQAKKAVNAGIWYHMAVVSGPGGMEFYINGQLVDRDDYSGSLSEAAGGANFIGKSNWPKDKMFEGYISELRIWSKKRSESEIHFAMDKALAKTENGLLAYYRFTDAADGLIPNAVDPNSPARMVGSARLENVPGIAPLLVPGELEKAALARYEKAKAALDTKQFVTAIDEFEWLIRAYPKYKDSYGLLAQARRLEAERQAEGFYQTGMQHVQQGNFREAFFEFESALDKVPGFKDAQAQMQSAFEKAKYRVAIYPFKTAVRGANITLLQQELTTNLIHDKSIFVEYVDQPALNRLAGQKTDFNAAKDEKIRVVVFGDLLTATATVSRPRREGKTAYTVRKRDDEVIGRGSKRTYYIVSQSVHVNCEVIYKILDTQTNSVLQSGTLRESLGDEVEYAEYYGDKNTLVRDVYKNKEGEWKVRRLYERRFKARRDLRNADEMMNEALRSLAQKIAAEVNLFTTYYSPPQPKISRHHAE